jgi:hypothetical protein
MSPWLSKEQIQRMHQAATADHSAEVEAERAWGFRAGQAVGRAEGRAAAEADFWHDRRATHQATAAAVSAMEEYGRRWARPGEEYGTRETFGQPVPGEYDGGPVIFDKHGVLDGLQAGSEERRQLAGHFQRQSMPKRLERQPDREHEREAG